MRAGEVINSYHVVTEPTNSGGGMCMWAFAIKNRREYFLKEFLQPKWPAPGSMGSPAGKERRRTNCYEFEGRHKEIMHRLADAITTPGGGNLVTAVLPSRYYILQGYGEGCYSVAVVIARAVRA